MRSLYLYLRPFISDGKIFVNNPRKHRLLGSFLPAYAFSTPDNINLEELLLRAIEKRGLLLAIGKKTGLIGGGRVVASDDDWKNHFIKLAEKATCIISVPSLNISTLWELQWLKDNQMQKKVVMLFTEKHFDANEMFYNFELLRGNLVRMGWRIPFSTQSGSLISFDAVGECAMHVKKSGFKKRAIAKIVDSVVKSQV